MGTQNLKEFVKKHAKFKDNKCPVCDNHIIIDNFYKLDADCIHYKCNNCSPNGCMISMTGTLLASENFNRILNDAQVKEYVQKKIRACNEGEVSIGMSDFRY